VHMFGSDFLYSLYSSMFPEHFFVGLSWRKGLLYLVPHIQDPLDPNTLVLARRMSFEETKTHNSFQEESDLELVLNC
jgi:hypothetical protein